MENKYFAFFMNLVYTGKKKTFEVFYAENKRIPKTKKFDYKRAVIAKRYVHQLYFPGRTG